MAMFQTVFDIIKATVSNWSRHKASLLSAALAFFTMLSLSPILLVVTSVAGLVYEDEAAQQQLVEQVRELSGPEGAAVVEKVMTNARFSLEGSIWAASLSVVILLFSGSAVFVHFKSSLNAIWQVEPKRSRRSAVGRALLTRGMSIAAVLILGFLFLLSLAMSAVLAALENYLVTLGPGIGSLISILHAVISLGVIGLLFTMVFRILPDAEVSPKASWIGGFTTVVLLFIGKWGIGMYLSNSAVGSAYGAAASVLVFMLWIYYTMSVVFLGAEFTHVLSDRFLGKKRSSES